MKWKLFPGILLLCFVVFVLTFLTLLLSENVAAPSKKNGGVGAFAVAEELGQFILCNSDRFINVVSIQGSPEKSL